MKEPDWKALPDHDHGVGKDDLVWVVKKTRGRFGKLNIAVPGDYGIVISRWTSSMGSAKVNILTEDMREGATTTSCVKKFGSLKCKKPNEYVDHAHWNNVKLTWMDNTYVPIIIMRELQTGRRPRGKYVISRAGGSVLVKMINSDDGIWLSQDKVHPKDWDEMMGSEERCHSVRVPEWLAAKSGAFGVVQ